MPASRKLGRSDAAALAKAASRVVVAKGKKVDSWKPAGKAPKACVDAMLGRGLWGGEQRSRRGELAAPEVPDRLFRSFETVGRRTDVQACHVAHQPGNSAAAAPI